MNNLIKTSLTRFAVLAVSSACLLTGCKNYVSTTPGVPMTPQNPTPVSGRTIPDTMAAEASAEAVRHFNVQVTAPNDPLSENLRQSVEGQLAAGGYKINKETPDIIVSLANTRSGEFDRTGNYIRYEGSANVGINRTWDSKRLGFETTAVRAKRGLGEAEAQRYLSSDLSSAVAGFVMRAARPEQAGLAVIDVTIRRPWLIGREDLIYNSDPAYAQQFIGAVKKLNGIIYCAMVAHNYESRSMVFRIVYLADAMPEGILNRLSTLPDLKINPRN